MITTLNCHRRLRRLETGGRTGGIALASIAEAQLRNAENSNGVHAFGCGGIVCTIVWIS